LRSYADQNYKSSQAKSTTDKTSISLIEGFYPFNCVRGRPLCGIGRTKIGLAKL
jgi:hypothetical protein